MKINVIIPVYNSEKYLSKCIESIQSQKHDNWEIYAVDDGSKDSSGEILERFSQSDNRINVFHIENHGAGYARNYALDKISMDDGYIVFVDSDDYIENDYFQLLSSHNEDIVFIDIAQRDENGMIIKEERMSVHSNASKDIIIRKQMTGCLPWGGWRKAIKTAIVLNNHIRYSEHTVGEEAIYSFQALHYSNSVGFIDRIVYSYVIHTGSLSTTRIDDPWGKVVENLKEEIIKMGVYEKYADTINAFHVSACCVSMRRLAFYYKFNEYKRRAKIRVEQLKTVLDSNEVLDNSSLRKEARIIYMFIRLRWYCLIYIVCKIHG